MPLQFLFSLKMLPTHSEHPSVMVWNPLYLISAITFRLKLFTSQELFKQKVKPKLKSTITHPVSNVSTTYDSLFFIPTLGIKCLTKCEENGHWVCIISEFPVTNPQLWCILGADIWNNHEVCSGSGTWSRLHRGPLSHHVHIMFV